MRVEGTVAGHETLTIPQFAKRVHRDRRTVYGWIKKGEMPEGSVLTIQGHLEIDWTIYSQSIRVIRGLAKGSM